MSWLLGRTPLRSLGRAFEVAPFDFYPNWSRNDVRLSYSANGFDTEWLFVGLGLQRNVHQ